MHLPLSLKDDMFKPRLLKGEPAITETASNQEPRARMATVRICNRFEESGLNIHRFQET